MRQTIKYLILVVLLLASGCARVAIQKEIALDLQDKKGAVIFYMNNKSITYNESVYRVLWIEERSQKAVFSDFWDVDKDLTEFLTKELTGLDLDVVPIHQVLNQENKYSVLEESLLKANLFAENSGEIVLDASTIEDLKTHGINYLWIFNSLEFRMLNITSLTSSANVAFPTWFLVYDLGSAKQIYKGGLWMMNYVDFGDSPRNLEANDLALLKEVAHICAVNAAKHQIPDILGREE